MPNGVLLTNEKLSRDSSYQKKGKQLRIYYLAKSAEK